jgi:GNAT superfamily N-acetyltransferase
MSATFRIYQTVESGLAEGLADVLIDCVEGGASVGFMLPLPREKAIRFWQNALASAARGERIVLVAEEVGTSKIVGTVQVVLAMPDNQPHRADVAKMQVHSRARRCGLGAALMCAAESAAREAGKTLLVLDTVTGSDAERLYARLGWQRCGVIPDYALWPQGGLCREINLILGVGPNLSQASVAERLPKRHSLGLSRRRRKSVVILRLAVLFEFLLMTECPWPINLRVRVDRKTKMTIPGANWPRICSASSLVASLTTSILPTMNRS